MSNSDEPDIIGEMTRELGINPGLGKPDQDDLLVQQARKMVDDDVFQEEMRRHPERFTGDGTKKDAPP
jgi:hypothetical protein